MPKEHCIKCFKEFWSDGPMDDTCFSCSGSSSRTNRQYWRDNESEYTYNPDYEGVRERERQIASTGKSVSQTVKSFEPVPERIPERPREKRLLPEPQKAIKNIQQLLKDKYYWGLIPCAETPCIDLGGEDGEGDLDLSGFTNLKELHLTDNKLTSTNFLNTIPNPEKLEGLYISANNIQPTNINVFSRFINLKSLMVGTINPRKERNRFYGSLKFCQNLTKLESICIEATDVNEGLEYLPLSLAKKTSEIAAVGATAGFSQIDCSPYGLDVGCKKIQDELRPYNYDVLAWQLSHPHLVYNAYPEYFTQADSKDKWVEVLGDELIKTQEKLNQTRKDEPQAIKRIERLENKTQLLKEIKAKVDTQKKNLDEMFSQIEINPKK